MELLTTEGLNRSIFLFDNLIDCLSSQLFIYEPSASDRSKCGNLADK